MTPKQRQKAVRARHLISFRRWVALRGNGDSVCEYVGMSVFDFRKYIESQWLEGMNWDNYGTDWVVDHIVALKYFDVFNRKDMKLCWAYHNMQPAWFWDNHAKGYCIDVTEKVLAGLKKSAIGQLLIEKIESVTGMFEPYYNKPNLI